MEDFAANNFGRWCSFPRCEDQVMREGPSHVCRSSEPQRTPAYPVDLEFARIESSLKCGENATSLIAPSRSRPF